ncbi:MAG: TlpA disulfide reductase family protein [Draconibacterium sp.]|nr:TlpA disulfide reductase family protein [Draconibacterium sp.]
MKKLLTILLISLFTTTTFAQLQELPKQEIPEDYGYIVKIGQQMPDVVLELTDGSKITTAELKGNVVMLQFTGSYCKVCREEMPHIEKDIWKKHKKNKNFKLIGIDLMETAETAKKFGKEMEITYPLAADPKGDIFYTFAAKGAGVTRNVIIDKTGKIVYMTRLFKEDEFKEMVDVIDYLLDS